MEFNNLLFHELFSANVYYLNHRMWSISALVRTEDRFVYIGLTDMGEMPEEISAAASNSSCSIYFTIEAIYPLLNAIDEALGAIDTRNEALGGVRELIGGVKASPDAFELIVNEVLMHEPLELEHTPS